MTWKELLTLGMTGISAVAAASLFAAGPKAESMPARNGWQLAEPIHYENLSVFPVVARDWPNTSEFQTLDEALASGEAIVTEQGGAMLHRSRDGAPAPIAEQGPQVNQLFLINRSGKPLVLLAGEIVSGGKQDRIVGKDRIVAPGAEPLALDVFCVENGRWSNGTRFAAAKMMVHPSVREKAAVDQNQEEVWAAVRSGTTAQTPAAAQAPPVLGRRALADIIASSAPTVSYPKMYGSPTVEKSVDEFADEVQRRFTRATSSLKGERVVGVVIAYGGEVAWSDVFASPALFERYWPKLLRSYVVEALARPTSKEQATLDDARDFFRSLPGRETSENEPGVYRWTEATHGHYAEITLEAEAPKPLLLHWVKIHRTS